MGEVSVRGAKLLNERVGWFGLSVWDLAAVGYSLIIFNAILKPYGLELLSFLFAGFVFLTILRIRLRSRPKTIRDFLRSKVSSPKLQYLLTPTSTKKQVR